MRSDIVDKNGSSLYPSLEKNPRILDPLNPRIPYIYMRKKNKIMNSEKLNNRQKDSTGKNKPIIQIIWGIALTLAGIGVFYRIPQVMPRIEQIKQFSSVMGASAYRTW